MPNIWFDVTTIVHWRRPPVGVVRVEAECFKYLAGLRHPNVRFCHFDKKTRVYQQIEPGYVLDIFNLHGHVPPGPEVPLTTAKKMTEGARKALKRAPQSLRQPLAEIGKRSTPMLRDALHQIRLASNAVEKFKSQVSALAQPFRAPAEPAGSPPPPFGAGDVLVSAGLDWDQKDLAYLYQLKLALGLKVILFCYDLIPVLLPHLCVGEVAGIFARYFVDVAWCADEVLCISKSSERDFLSLIRETGAPQPRTSIIRLGANIPTRKGEAKLEDMVKGRFLLFVSTIERRKNHEVIYRAIAQLAERGRTDLPQIVFVGMVGWGVGDFLNDLRIDPRVRGKFIILNHVSDSQLALLYKNADFTLYPSLYEGWGLPLAESLAAGKFCLASNSSSLPEVAGSLVEYVEPWESRRWADRIEYYLDHPEELRRREKAISEQYVAPRWEDAGRTVFQVAERLLWTPTNAQPTTPAVAWATTTG